jgi:hypothetical protein
MTPVARVEGLVPGLQHLGALDPGEAGVEIEAHDPRPSVAVLHRDQGVSGSIQSVSDRVVRRPQEAPVRVDLDAEDAAEPGCDEVAFLRPVGGGVDAHDLLPRDAAEKERAAPRVERDPLGDEGPVQAGEGGRAGASRRLARREPRGQRATLGRVGEPRESRASSGKSQPSRSRRPRWQRAASRSERARYASR